MLGKVAPINKVFKIKANSLEVNKTKWYLWVDTLTRIHYSERKYCALD
jgi:hypothetical protein